MFSDSVHSVNKEITVKEMIVAVEQNTNKLKNIIREAESSVKTCETLRLKIDQANTENGETRKLLLRTVDELFKTMQLSFDPLILNRSIQFARKLGLVLESILISQMFLITGIEVSQAKRKGETLISPQKQNLFSSDEAAAKENSSTVPKKQSFFPHC